MQPHSLASRFDNSAIYVPVLAAQQGEFDAVASLPPSTRGRIRPLFEIGPPRRPRRRHPTDPDPVPKPLGLHLKERMESLVGSWGYEHEVLVDFVHLPETDDRTAAIKDALAHAEAIGLPAVAVVTPEHSGEMLKVVADYARRTGGGICLRIDPFHLVTEPADPFDMVEGLGLRSSDVDLIIDAGEVGCDVEHATARLLSLLAHVPKPKAWRRLVCLGGCFPAPLHEHVPNGELRHFPRADWLAWLRVHQIGLEHPPLFGDYGVHAPGTTPAPGFRGAKSIRFSGGTTWAAARGQPPSTHVDGEYSILARRLRSTIEWRQYPDDHCTGCQRIAAARTRAGNHGNPTNWVAAAVHHHIVATTADLATVTAAA